MRSSISKSPILTARSLHLAADNSKRAFTTTYPSKQNDQDQNQQSRFSPELPFSSDAFPHQIVNADKAPPDLLAHFNFLLPSWAAPEPNSLKLRQSKRRRTAILGGQEVPGAERYFPNITDIIKHDTKRNLMASLAVEKSMSGFIQNSNSSKNAAATAAAVSSSQSNDTKPGRKGKTECKIGDALEGKKCVITGASRGIGAEIARRFANEGASCILVGRNEELLGKVRDSLNGAGKIEHRIVIGNVGSEKFWLGLRSEKNIDILVNAAGLTHYSPLFVTTPTLLEEVIQTNLVGTMMGCRTVGKSMMASRKGGCIINVASLLGIKGGRGSTTYAASKAGVIGLTRALAAEIGEKGIRVNVIVPGYIETDMTEAMTPEARSDALNAIPLKRFGQSSEIAEGALFLATNKYANNCVLNLDGGLSAV